MWEDKELDKEIRSYRAEITGLRQQVELANGIISRLSIRGSDLAKILGGSMGPMRKHYLTDFWAEYDAAKKYLNEEC
ncbi:MAG TPA: hypothetical protein P5153_17100 [Candidatus Krumholzibacteria bacterium]|nr:hypothetical protein [Candidatus Krumholzibacteria bacterium]